MRASSRRRTVRRSWRTLPRPVLPPPALRPNRVGRQASDSGPGTTRTGRWTWCRPMVTWTGTCSRSRNSVEATGAGAVGTLRLVVAHQERARRRGGTRPPQQRRHHQHRHRTVVQREIAAGAFNPWEPTTTAAGGAPRRVGRARSPGRCARDGQAVRPPTRRPGPTATPSAATCSAAATPSCSIRALSSSRVRSCRVARRWSSGSAPGGARTLTTRAARPGSRRAPTAIAPAAFREPSKPTSTNPSGHDIPPGSSALVACQLHPCGATGPSMPGPQPTDPGVHAGAGGLRFKGVPMADL